MFLEHSPLYLTFYFLDRNLENEVLQNQGASVLLSFLFGVYRATSLLYTPLELHCNATELGFLFC